VALASRRLSERSLIALQIDFVLCCCDAQVVAAKGHTRTTKHVSGAGSFPRKRPSRPSSARLRV
jgi:hypothetical protein